MREKEPVRVLYDIRYISGVASRNLYNLSSSLCRCFQTKIINWSAPNIYSEDILTASRNFLMTLENERLYNYVKGGGLF